ncbi:MAG: hypothetical protein M2R45_04033 [Verrucomicrobia subdivision 3 bacterium]|nr:hypothetical protein [Limisphaerales bacterium]MCS1416983.1 hypothetical protein [Limisphaerales bacterium]
MNHFIPILLAVTFDFTVFGHPIPDLPVRSSFQPDGSVTIQVEVDPRCFAADPLNEPYLENAILQDYTNEQKAELFKKAKQLIENYVEFWMHPLGQVLPHFDMSFTTFANKDLTWNSETPETNSIECAETPVVITAEWKTNAPKMSGYQIKATEEGTFSVYFINHLNGENQPLNVLFPGEDSYILDLEPWSQAIQTESAPQSAKKESRPSKLDTFRDFIRQGYAHVLPLGWDHVLFVVGLVLLSRQLRPLIYQISIFTVAHTATLALATFGWVKIPPEIIEPIIALSITCVAIENIFKETYSHRRLIIVGIFGLIHGLGFASVLAEKNLPVQDLVIGLLGFNLGVELGQLTVVLGIVLLTLKLDQKSYRKYCSVPGSVLIGMIGIYWTIKRVFLG